jgi:hypothetical protein
MDRARGPGGTRPFGATRQELIVADAQGTVCTPELWSVLEQTVRRRGGPFPAGNALIRVHCQENAPGRADAVAVVRRGGRVQSVAMRLDASSGRWMVTLLEVLGVRGLAVRTPGAWRAD